MRPLARLVLERQRLYRKASCGGGGGGGGGGGAERDYGDYGEGARAAEFVFAHEGEEEDKDEEGERRVASFLSFGEVAAEWPEKDHIKI